MPTNEASRKTYPGKQFDIPFYEASSGIHILKLNIKRDRFSSSGRTASNPDDFDAADIDIIKSRASNRFITHYFPEFYTFLYDREKFTSYTNANIDVVTDLEGDIKVSATITYIYPAPDPARVLIIILINYNVEKKRADIKLAHCFPSFEENLNYFNEQQDIEGATSESTFAIGTIGETNSSLNDGLKAFNTQMQGMEGQLTLNPAMDALAATTQSALSLIIKILTIQLKATTPSYKFGQADTMTIYFGTQRSPGKPLRPAVARIDYLIIEDSISNRPMKIGYLSNVKYNNLLSDPLTLVTLKNYQTILSTINSPDMANGQSFMNFMRNSEVQAALGDATTIFDPSSPLVPPNQPGNPFINAAKQMSGIDVLRTDELEKGFKTAFSSKQLRALKIKVADNPEVFTKVLMEGTKKTLQNAIDTVKVVNDILETGPMGFIEKNPIVSNIFKMFGIKEMAKEAMICLTMGMNFEIGRISKALQNSLINAQASLYAPPDLPRPGGDIRKPYISPDDFKMFTIGGDIWKQILDVVINALQQSVLEIIKKLAELLKYSCPLNNPRSRDYGATDIAALINPSLQTPSLTGPGTALDRLAQARGLTAPQLNIYFSALSQILSSMEICRLFTDRSSVGSELMDKLIDFNKEYEVPYFSNNLITYSAILSFFLEMSMIVDVTDLCNEVANEVYFANEENISFCLTPDNEPTVEMEELLDLMENGIELKMPTLNFNCPDKENYISDPTITVSIPEMFDSLVQLVELQFAESAEAVKSILLEQKYTADSGGSILATLSESEIDYEANGWPPKLNPIFISKIIEALDSVSSFDLSSCDADVSQILGFDAGIAAQIAPTAAGVVSSTLNSAEFVNAIEGIKDKLQDIEDSAAAAGGGSVPLFPSYRFNLQFYREYINYIELSQLSYSNESLSIPYYYNSRLINDAREFISATRPPNLKDGNSLPITDGSYKPVEINFNFPMSVPFLFGTYPSGSLSTYGNIIDPTNEPVGTVGATCLDQPQIDQIIDDGGVVAAGTGCDGTTHAPASPQETQVPGCTNQSRVMGKIIYDLVIKGHSEIDPEVLRSFQDVYPTVYKQIKYSSSIIKQVPLKELNPSMLIAIQTYVSTNQTIMLSTGGLLERLVYDYEQINGCRVVAEDSSISVVQMIYDTIMGIKLEDLETTSNYLKIIYPRSASRNPNIFVDFQSAGDYLPKEQVLQDISRSMLEQEFDIEGGSPQNVYIKAFTDTFLGTNIPSVAGLEDDETSSDSLIPGIRTALEAEHFPIVYGLLVDNMFNYIITNGVFDAPTLQSLKFFHLNENCPPGEISDLLDIQGIKKQMTDEYVESMCGDPAIPDRTKVRNIVKYGMELLLIQMQIAQILIKNIFVMSAFKIDSILDNKDGFIFKFFRDQLTISYLTFLSNSRNMDESIIRRDVVDYFNIKINRESNVAQGGIKNSLGEIVFPTGTTFSVVDHGAFVGFDEIIDYFISERLILGATSINNAIRNAVPNSNPVSIDEALLASMQTFTVASENPTFLMEKVSQFYGGDPSPRIFLTRKYITLGRFGIDRARVKMWYYYGGSDPNIVNIFKFAGTIPAFGLPNSSASMMEAIRAGLVTADAETTPDCLNQTEIDDTLALGGNVPQGRGCVGTTHAPDDSTSQTPIESGGNGSPGSGYGST
tara:strand:+ start:22126 stop:27108 length:4983 start_codon:yes stop_codon:yes gene_type:complete